MVGELPTRVAGWLRPAWAEVDLDAIAANVSYLKSLVAPAELCAVVKADAYGHGAVPVARAALGAGATWLAVALAEEGHELREAGICAPVLVLSEPSPEAMKLVARDRLTATIYTQAGLRALCEAAKAAAAGERLPVHIKLDTGMHRVGAGPDAAVELARAVSAEPRLELEGIFTHLAVADEPSNSFTALQLQRFEATVQRLRDEGIRPRVLHAANSAGALFHPGARYGLVRLGIAVYGLAPSLATRNLPSVARLRPALSLKARVSYCKVVKAGDGLSYGLRYRLAETSDVATVPLGYADGVPRRLSQVGGEVLIGGRRRPVAGAITMDQPLGDCGPASGVRAGDEVVLIGQQGCDAIDAWEWAERLETIAYEVTCGLSARLPRAYRYESASTTKSMQAVSASMSEGSMEGNMAMRNWLRPSRR
jgi:alanine racemase